jgi:ADP-ribose pyrophosphatase
VIKVRESLYNIKNAPKIQTTLYFTAIMQQNQASQPGDEVLLVTPRFRVIRQIQQLGGGKTRARESIQHPGAVVILPLLADDKVVLIQNYRMAVGETLWELPAGTLDHDEPPIATAKRELQEETGYQAAHIEPLGYFWMSPGILRERMHCFVATGLTAGAMALEPGEEIQTHIVTWHECLAMIERGDITDAKTVATILLWERKRS